jgi:hypothetical protein
MQNIRRLNYFCKDGENRKKLVYFNATFRWRPPSSGVLFLDCVKEKSNEYIGMLGLADFYSFSLPQMREATI